MTPASEPRRSSEEVARIGTEIFDRVVKPTLRPDDGKHVAIDIVTGEYEIDINEWDAITRLTDRRRGIQIFLMRINKPYRMSFRMRYGTVNLDKPPPCQSNCEQRKRGHSDGG